MSMSLHYLSALLHLFQEGCFATALSILRLNGTSIEETALYELSGR